MAKRSKTMRNVTLIAVLLGVALVVALFGNVDFQGFNVAQPSSLEGETGDIICTSEVSPSITFKAYDKYNRGTAITGNFIYREKGSVAWSNDSLGNAVSLGVGKTYEVVYGITTSDFVDEPYGPFFEYRVPCEQTDEVEKEMTNDEVEGSMTGTFYNADGDASAETFSAGVAQTISLKIAAGSDEEFGNAYLEDDTPNVVCLNLNKTAWDVPEFVRVRSTNVELNRISTPLLHSVDSTDTAYCYEAPVFTEMDTYLDIRLKPDDSNAPAYDDTASVYAANHFINNDADVMYGVETEEGDAVAVSDPDTITLDFTA